MYFSRLEEVLIDKLGRKKMLIADLTDEFYCNYYEVPLNGQNIVAGMVRRINKKCDYYKLSWFINGHGCGRKGKMVFRESR